MPLPSHRSAKNATFPTSNETLNSLKAQAFGHGKYDLPNSFTDQRWFNCVDGSILLSTEQVLIDSIQQEARVCAPQQPKHGSILPDVEAQNDTKLVEMGKYEKCISSMKRNLREKLAAPVKIRDLPPSSHSVRVLVYVPWSCTPQNVFSAVLPVNGGLRNLDMLERRLAGSLGGRVFQTRARLPPVSDKVWKYQLNSRLDKWNGSKASTTLEVESDYRELIVATTSGDDPPYAVLTKASWANESPSLAGKLHAKDDVFYEPIGTETEISYGAFAMEGNPEDDPLAGNVYEEDGTPFFDEGSPWAEWLEKWLAKQPQGNISG